MELKQYNLFFLYQETVALTKRLFIQLKRRPSTLLAGILQPIIWLFLFGALFSKAPEGFLPGVDSYGNFCIDFGVLYPLITNMLYTPSQVLL